MREDVHEVDGGRRAARGRRALPARPLDRRGRERSRAAAARRPSAAPGRRRRRRRGGRDRAGGAPPAGRDRDPDRRRAPPDRVRARGPGELPDTNSLMLAAQAEEAGCEAHRFEIAPDEPEQIVGGGADRGSARSDLVIVIAGSSAGRDDHTAAGGGRGRDARGARSGGQARPPGRARGRQRREVRAGTAHAGPRRPRLPRLRRAHLRHLRRAAAGPARGRPAAGAAAVAQRAARAQARLHDGHGRLGPGAARPRRRAASWPPRSRAAPACSPRWSAPTACLWSPPRSRATTPARRSRSACCAASGEIERTIVGHGLARPRARPGRLRAARARPDA